jgi:hypothetical protein
MLKRLFHPSCEWQTNALTFAAPRVRPRRKFVVIGRQTAFGYLISVSLNSLLRFVVHLFARAGY